MPGERSLLVLILDVSPVVWGERDMQRKAMDKARIEKGKRSAGPGTLDEMLVAVQAFCGAFDNLQRDGVLVIIGVAGNEKPELLYPNENDLQQLIDDGSKVDIRKLNEALMMGVSRLVTKAAATAERVAQSVANDDNSTTTEPNKSNIGDTTSDKKNRMYGTDKAVMAAALSVALCVINRFLVTVHAGVSALTADTSTWNRHDDGGILSILGGGSDSGTNNDNNSGGGGGEKTRSSWSPRIFMIQASEDRTCDYNAFMNCTFASSKHNVALDGCYLASGLRKKESSAFLEQACDRTNGVFLSPTGGSQVGGCLTEVLLSVFLPPLSIRSKLNLPALDKVDFRAKCFETGESVDMAYVCNQCLSIFKNKKTDFCPTCNLPIMQQSSSNVNGSNNSRLEA